MDTNIKTPLNAREARVCATGWNVNRPKTFPGLGDFIGWAGGLERMPNGDLLLAHSAGYWHASFASPRLFAEETREQYTAAGWPVDFVAPTGGQSMATRSTDNGVTWSRPAPIINLPLDDTPVTLFVCQDATVLCFINVQASWYGFKSAPSIFRDDLNGLNTQQCVIRSADSGQTWSQPIWFNGPGSFYERSHGQAIQLSDGGILWPTYCSNQGEPRLFGAIHRSDDSGEHWQLVSTIHRKDNDVDEPAIACFTDGQLVMVARPDGAVFFSDDDGVGWRQAGQISERGVLKAPRLFVLEDGTLVCVATHESGLYVFLSQNRGLNWTPEIPLDASCYGYPGGLQLEDGSLLISYCQSGKAPNRVYVIRFRVNDARDGIALLHVG